MKGVKIVLTDERNDDQDVFLFENGIQEFVSYLNEEKDTLGNVMYFEGKKTASKSKLPHSIMTAILKRSCHLSTTCAQKTAARTK